MQERPRTGMEDPASPEARREQVTDLLRAHAEGDGEAMARLTPLVYDELRELAHRQLLHERQGHTLQTTALVHEAWVRLVGLDRMRFNDRAHFFALSGRLMRQILTDYAKRRRRLKRGGGERPVELDEATDRVQAGLDDRSIEELIALDAALTQLATLSERQARVVECRFFAGMSVEETAEAVRVSPATVKRDWKVARAWLHRELRADPPRTLD